MERGFDTILAEADKAVGEVAELCSHLVRMNSSHPQGRTDHCVEYIRAYFKKHGIGWEIHSNHPDKPNIAAKIKGRGDGKVLWVGHLDVVPEGSRDLWTHDPYGGLITDGGLIHGRGSSDMKGACAAAMVAARLLSELKEPPESSVEFWFTADEEIGGGEGARWLARTNRLEGDVCVIGDGNGGGTAFPSIDLGCKGHLRTRLIARGKTAHGSTPFLGENAISRLIRAIPWVEKIGEYRLALPADLEASISSSLEFMINALPMSDEHREAAGRIFHYPTVSCNLISGGVKINVVPDHAEAEFDIRLTPGSRPLEVKKRIEELVEEAGIPGVEVSVEAPQSVGYYESPDSDFARALSETVERVTGRKPGFKILAGGTDAIAIKHYTGIPCLGYGTSMTGQAHQPNEYNTIENLILGVKIYAGFPLIYTA